MVPHEVYACMSFRRVGDGELFLVPGAWHADYESAIQWGADMIALLAAAIDPLDNDGVWVDNLHSGAIPPCLIVYGDYGQRKYYWVKNSEGQYGWALQASRKPAAV